MHLFHDALVSFAERRVISMNQELMTLDFWQDTIIYEGKTFPVGTLACDALNVPADTIAKMNEQCENE